MKLFTRLLGCFFLGYFLFGSCSLVSNINAQTIRTVVEDGPEMNNEDRFRRIERLSLNNRGQVAFSSVTRSPSNRNEIWSEGNGSLTPVASRDASAPGTDTEYEAFISLELNDAGQTAFLARLADKEISRDERFGVWATQGDTLDLVARAGQAIPELDATLIFPYRATNSYQAGYSMAFNNSSQLAFWGESPHRMGLWSNRNGTLDLIYRPGDPAPGTPGDFVYLNHPDEYFVHYAALNESGQTAFVGGYQGEDERSPIQAGVWSERNGTLSLIASAEDIAPDTNKLFSDFWSVSINDAGQTAFMGGMEDSPYQYGLWSEGGGTLAKVAMTGELAPGTDAIFGILGNLYLYPVSFNNAGESLFQATLTGDEVDDNNDRGIWSNVGGTLDLIARLGEIAPGTTEKFAEFYYHDLNDLGQAMIVARLTGEDSHRGIWAQDTNGELTLIAKEGDQIDVDGGPGVELRTIELLGNQRFTKQIPYYAFPYGTDLNDSGQVAFIAKFSEDSIQGVYVSNMVAVPEPSSLLLLALATLAITNVRCRRATA